MGIVCPTRRVCGGQEARTMAHSLLLLPAHVSLCFRLRVSGLRLTVSNCFAAQRRTSVSFIRWKENKPGATKNRKKTTTKIRNVRERIIKVFTDRKSVV